MTMTCAVNHCDSPATHTWQPQPYEVAWMCETHYRAVTEPPQHITMTATILEWIGLAKREFKALPPSAAVTRAQADALVASLPTVQQDHTVASSLLGIPLLVRELGEALPRPPTRSHRLRGSGT